jgi:N-acetylmuramoyl-L-alanine amidase
MNIVISSGHGKFVPGAIGLIDEHAEAVRVVNQVAIVLRSAGVEVVTYEDVTSHSQSENLNAIVSFHNKQGSHDYDVSVHFNAYVETTKPMGCECLFVTQDTLAARVAQAISRTGRLINRGAKFRDDLAFLNGTHEPSILLEVCFVDSSVDVDRYTRHFDAICQGIAEALVGKSLEAQPAAQPPKVHFKGRCSWFGGPDDMGVAPDEGLAFFYAYEDAPHLFLPEQPPGTTGLARRLNPEAFYLACRWNYDVTSKEMLRDQSHVAIVRAGKREFMAHPADWGPHEQTNRVADISPGLMEALGIMTDEVVEVRYPVPSPGIDTTS